MFFSGPKLFEIVFFLNRFLKLLDVVFSFENDFQLVRVFRKGMKCAVRSGTLIPVGDSLERALPETQARCSPRGCGFV